MMKPVSYYMDLNYTLIIDPKLDFDGSVYYIAYYKELEGLEGVGSTKELALKDLKQVKKDWFRLSLKIGAVIPEPQTKEELNEHSD